MKAGMADGRYDIYYRHYLALAERTDSPGERALFLQMAQSWKALAEQAETIRDLFAHVKPAGHA
jgi:hypothetical protein